MSIEAMKQALEALELIREADMAGATPKMVIEARKMYDPTITSLSQAIAEAEKQEPVAWINPNLEHMAEEAECVTMCLNDRGVPTRDGDNSFSLWGRVEQYAKASQRQPLTDELIDAEHDKLFPAPFLVSDRKKVRVFARAIVKAAHGIGKKK